MRSVGGTEIKAILSMCNCKELPVLSASSCLRDTFLTLISPLARETGKLRRRPLLMRYAVMWRASRGIGGPSREVGYMLGYQVR